MSAPTDAVPDSSVDSASDKQKGDVAAQVMRPPARPARPTPLLLARLGVPTPSSAHLGIPAGDSPVARALRITTERTPLDRILAGDRPDESEAGSMGRAIRVLVDPGLWLSRTYRDVAFRLRERYPQVWLALAGSTPPRARLTLAQRVAAQRFVEGSGKARIAVLAGDADLQAMVRAARTQRRFFYLCLLGLAGAAAASFFV